MNTDEQVPNEHSINGDPISPLISALQQVDENNPNSSVNQTSIDDNNGGRIELNDDIANQNNIRK